MAFALALSFLDCSFLAALHPDATRSYVNGMFGRGTTRGLALSPQRAGLPNLCVWLLVPARARAWPATSRTAAPRSRVWSPTHVATPAALGIRRSDRSPPIRASAPAGDRVSRLMAIPTAARRRWVPGIAQGGRRDALQAAGARSGRWRFRLPVAVACLLAALS
jgi:hypothetical protein